MIYKHLPQLKIVVDVNLKKYRNIPLFWNIKRDFYLDVYTILNRI